MDSLFYIIVVMLIMLKLMIWVCVFYSRARRARVSRCQRGIILIQDGRRRVIITGDYDSVLNAGIVENSEFSAGPPSYDEVLRTKSTEAKPPSYEQVVQSSYGADSMTPLSQDTMGLPPYSNSQTPGIPEVSANLPAQQSHLGTPVTQTTVSSSPSYRQPVAYQESTNPV